jgi:hypothetical protein
MLARELVKLGVGIGVGIGASIGVGAFVLHEAKRRLHAHKRPCLRLVQEIPLGDIGGRLDHFSFDRERKLLFLACLAENVVLVVDAFAGKVLRRLSQNMEHPQGVLFVEKSCRLYVANAASGTVCVFDAQTWQPLACIDFDDEADNLRYDSELARVFVGYGEGAIGAIDDGPTRPWGQCPQCMHAGHDHAAPKSCACGIVRVDPCLDLPCGGEHPESFHLGAQHLYVNVADERAVRKLDRGTRAVDAEWPLPAGASHNFPMHLDEARGRVYVGVRKPPQVLVLDSCTGAVVAAIPCAADMDDLCWDAKRQRLYVVGGEGAVTVIQRHGGCGGGGGGGGGERFSVEQTVASGIGARTGLWFDSRDALYIAAPATASTGARLLVYEAQT